MPRSDSCEVVLVMPPLTHVLSHADIGIPQLTAWLRAEHVRVTQADLNAEFLFGELYHEDHLLKLMGHLSAPGLLRLTGLMPYQKARISGMLTRLTAMGLPESRSEEAYWAVLQHMANLETELPPEDQTILEVGGPVPAPARETWPQVARELARGLETSLFLRSELVRLFHREFMNPGAYSPAEVMHAVRRANPMLDEFLARRLDPLITPEVGVFGMTIHSTEQVVPALRMGLRVRTLFPRVQVIVGGPWVIAAARNLQQSPELFDCFHAAAFLEGEEILSLLSRDPGRDPVGIPGILFCREGRVHRNEPSPLPALEDIPAPVFDGFNTHLPEPELPFRTIRGCYWGRCVFCYHVFQDHQETYSCHWHSTLSDRHLDSLVELVKRAREVHGTNRLVLADNATSPAYMGRIARRILDEGLEVGWETMARFDPGFTPELCSQLARSGCRQIMFGLETSLETEQRRLNKGINLKLVRSCLEACKSAGMGTVLFLLDYPSSGEHAWEETLEWCLTNHELVDWFIPARFKLGRTSGIFQDPATFGLTLPDSADTSLSVFDLPFQAKDWTDLPTFLKVTEHGILRFIVKKMGGKGSAT